LKNTLLVSTFAALVMMGSPAYSQESPDDANPDALLPGEEEMMEPTQYTPSLGVSDDPFDGLSNVEVIVSELGEVNSPWVRSQGCADQECGALIAHEHTGEVAYFIDEWMGGFIQTGRGEQVIRLILTSDED
jgi:hypothetical protein